MELNRITGILFLIIAGCHGNSDTSAIRASGTIETTEVNISPKVAGQLLSLRVDEGSAVHVGDTLAIIDSTNYVLNLHQALAAVGQADAQLRLAENGSRHEDIEQAAEQVNQARAALASAEKDEKRMQDLLATHSATQKQYDDADTRLTTAKASLNAAQQLFNKLKTGSRPEDIATMRARFVQAQAQAAMAQQQLHDCVVIAPTSGMVTHRVMSQGEMIGMNSTIVSVSVLDPVKITIYVSDKDLGKVKLGEHASVAIDAFKDKSFTGTVIYISPDAEFTPKNVQTTEDRLKLVFAVKIEVANPDGLLKPGLPADAVLQ